MEPKERELNRFCGAVSPVPRRSRRRRRRRRGGGPEIFRSYCNATGREMRRLAGIPCLSSCFRTRSPILQFCAFSFFFIFFSIFLPSSRRFLALFSSFACYSHDGALSLSAWGRTLARCYPVVHLRVRSRILSPKSFRDFAHTNFVDIFFAVSFLLSFSLRRFWRLLLASARRKRTANVPHETPPASAHWPLAVNSWSCVFRQILCSCKQVEGIRRLRAWE